MDHASPDGRLSKLLQFLELDPRNPALLADAADAAMKERQPQLAADLLIRYAEIAPLPEREQNMAGLAAMQLQNFVVALAHLEPLLSAHLDDPALRFNVAWSRAMLDDDTALDLLDDQLARDWAQAAMLRVRLLHDQGMFDEAIAAAHEYVGIHPDHKGLLAVTSTLAIDMEEPEFAAECARRGGDHPDALMTLGTLALRNDRNLEALDLFTRALLQNQNAPRAWVGSGLAKLIAGEAATAASEIQRGAELFDEHVGSWIAAGWAHLVAKDLDAARPCFERALALDRNFAESHGSLAVINLIQGRMEEGRRATETALKLDRQSFSGVLANAILLSSEGHSDRAEALIERALHTPIDANGRTIAQSLARYGLRGS